MGRISNTKTIVIVGKHKRLSSPGNASPKMKSKSNNRYSTHTRFANARKHRKQKEIIGFGEKVYAAVTEFPSLPDLSHPYFELEMLDHITLV